MNKKPLTEKDIAAYQALCGLITGHRWHWFETPTELTFYENGQPLSETYMRECKQCTLNQQFVVPPQRAYWESRDDRPS